MTTVGHGLAGMAIAVALAPRLRRPAGWVAVLAIGLVAGNMPDAPLPYWGHNQYLVSHSIFVNAAVLLVLAVALLLLPRGQLAFRGRLALLIAAAWLSHLLLDCCYRYGCGLAMFWPISRARLALPLPWFDGLPYGRWQLDQRALRIALKDVEYFGPLLLLAACGRAIGWWRQVRARKRAPPEPPTVQREAPRSETL